MKIISIFIKKVKLRYIFQLVLCLQYMVGMVTVSVFLFFCQIIHEIQKFEIQIYQLPHCDDDEDDDFRRQTEDLRVKIPVYSVLG